MQVSFRNFFDYYIVNPLSNNLSIGEKIFCLFMSVILGPLTLGIPHIRCAILANRHIKPYEALALEHKEAFHEVVRRTRAAIKPILFPSTEPQTPSELKIHELSKIPSLVGRAVQHFVEHYATKLPPQKDVVVPIQKDGRVQWVKWETLTREEKIKVNNTGTREHNQLALNTPEFMVDRLFFPHQGEVFTENDPRKSHGSDHASRVAIFAAAFANLYHKYHPNHTVSRADIVLCQLAAAGHDMGRLSEGPDVYDERSAELTVAELRKLGITDESLLAECKEAIANKDSTDFKKKSLIAKCTQNADCMEFARLLLNAPDQDPYGFENSRHYLDIYREMEEIALKKNPGNMKAAVLKNGLTFEDFCFELDALRREANSFIYQTHQKAARERFSMPGKNYYDEMLKVLTPEDSPLLYSHLLSTSVITSPSLEKNIVQAAIDLTNKAINYGLSKIKTDQLEKRVTKLRSLIESEPPSELIDQMNDQLHLISDELKAREELINNFLRSLKSVDASDRLKAFAMLTPLLKEQYREEFVKNFNFYYTPPTITFLRATIYSDIQAFLIEKPIEQPFQNIIIADMRCAHINSNLKSFETTKMKEEDKELCAAEFKRIAIEMSQFYDQMEQKNPLVQTTASLLFEKAATLYIEIGKNDLAREALKDAAEQIILDPLNQFFDFEKLFSDLDAGTTSRYCLTDCHFLAKRKVRVSEKTIEGQNYVEMCLELSPAERKKIAKKIALWPTERVPTIYHKKVSGVFVKEGAVTVGSDLKLTFGKAEVLVGDENQYWNQYHTVRIRIPKGASAQELHRACSLLGLPSVLMPSREEDIHHEMLSRSLLFRYPQIVYGSPEKSAQEIYDSLSKPEQLVIDYDLDNQRLTFVGTNHLEAVQPLVSQEAWKMGVRSVGSFINAGSLEATTDVLKNILTTGLQSSQERFMNGILGLGCVPILNFKTGSADQVFTRILSKKMFNERFPLDNFAIQGPIFIMLDPRILERLPYAYAHDRGGVRNPDFRVPLFLAQKQAPVIGFKGSGALREQVGFSSFGRNLGKGDFPLNEVMFDRNIGAKYIQRIVVKNELERSYVIATLQKNGIFIIGNKPVEQVVVASEILQPNLVDHFDEESYPGEDNGLAYL